MDGAVLTEAALVGVVLGGVLLDGVVLIEAALVGVVLGGVLLVRVLLVQVILIGEASHFLWCLLYHQRIGSK